MIDKRLIQANPQSKKTIFFNVLAQWCSLLVNIAMISALTWWLAALLQGQPIESGKLLFFFVLCLLLRFICTLISSKMAYLSGKQIKKSLRRQILEKVEQLGSAYHHKINTAQIIQISTEGIEQLEIYFSAYLPQFFYAMVAPLTLFIVIAQIDFFAAVILFICVPLIPVSIIVVQRWAKKLLSKYWNQYTELGDSFLENLQGLTTLKIYQADEFKHRQMNEEAEKFRKITMKVLTMQLNSISIMDLVAYGGAALGILIAVLQFQRGVIDFAQALLIILLAADFFIPMRQLGSFFHIAMNGMAAADKIFTLLGMDVEADVKQSCPEDFSIQVEEVGFSYDDKPVLQHLNFEIPQHQLISIVGESGSGKSTFASLLMKKNTGFQGSITLNGIKLEEISQTSLFEKITYVSSHATLFKGTVRENLAMAKPDATEIQMKEVLRQVQLLGFVEAQQGLDTPILEGAANLSGGQRQRLVLARALLKDSAMIIFDEATSNIDMESEEIIMKLIGELAKTKTVLLISHRLANVTSSKQILVLEKGIQKESGTHEQLLAKKGIYFNLWNTQAQQEHFEKEVTE